MSGWIMYPNNLSNFFSITEWDEVNTSYRKDPGVIHNLFWIIEGEDMYIVEQIDLIRENRTIFNLYKRVAGGYRRYYSKDVPLVLPTA